MERVLGVGVSCVFGQELEAVTCAVLRPQRELALQSPTCFQLTLSSILCHMEGYSLL